MNEDTFVALSTPAGESALAVIRVSGPSCLDLVTGALDDFSPIPRKAVLGNYKSVSGEILDNVVYIYYKKGNSYTGESMLELSCHGNPLIIQHIIEDIKTRGCRIADPGEFTRTAFLNGKIDLSQAEAVMDLIRARSDRAINAAQKQLSGSLGKLVDRYLNELISVIAHLEAYIDFPEEDLPDENTLGPINDLSALVSQFNSLISTSQYSTLLHEGIRTVIVGPPNVGKSSFLNRVAGFERAIVSEEPGTTRDFIEERILVSSYLLRVIDTAGIHSAGSKIEQLGIDKTYEQIESADFILLMIDSNEVSPTLSSSFLNLLNSKPYIVIENKFDLPEHKDHSNFCPDKCHYNVSMKTGEGMNSLLDGIRKELEKGIIIPDENSVIVSARHASALEEAKVSIQRALNGLRNELAVELCASELRMALEQIGQITGKIDNERMLDKLFAEFCIGK